MKVSMKNSGKFLLEAELIDKKNRKGNVRVLR